MTAWKHLEEVLDSNIKNKEKFERLGDEHLVKFFQNNINELLLKEFNANRIIDKLVEKYDLDKKYLKTIFSPMYPLFDYNEEIVIEKFEKFIKFFGSINILCKFIKNDCNTPDFSSKCIFDCDDNEIEEKIDFLQNLLSLTKSQTVLFIADNVYYFKIKNSFLESKINSYARALNTTADIIKKKIIRYPNFFYAKINKMAERVKGFARIYQLEENKAQEVILKYPTLIEYWITSHRDYYKILKQYINPTECICEYPFIYNFIDFVNGKFLGDFDNIDDVISNIDYVKEKFGIIEDCITYDNQIFCVTNNNGHYTLVNIGNLVNTYKINEHNNFNYDKYSKYCVISKSIRSYNDYLIREEIQNFIDILNKN